MSVRKITNQNGEIIWLVRVYENGRGSKQISKSFDRKVDADNWLSEFNKEKKNREGGVFTQLTFEKRTLTTEAEYWLLDAHHRYSLSHITRARTVIQYIVSKFGNLSITKITPEFLSNFQQHELKRGLNPATVNRHTGFLTAILNFSVKHRRIPFSPASGFEKIKYVAPEMSYWSETESVSFLSHVNKKYPEGSEKRWVYVVYLLALNTAVRAGEIWGLKVSDIKSTQGLITIRRQYHRIETDFTPTKGKKERLVPGSRQVISELLKICKDRSRDDLIFKNSFGNPIHHDNFRNRQFSADLKTWGGRPIRFHDLRHTSTTLIMESGVSLRTVKEICGHASINTTMNYAHLVGGAVEKVAQTFSIVPSEQEEKNNLKIIK